MMKKSLLTLAAIAALTSCSQDDLMNNTDSQASDAIGVNVFVPTASRGTAYNSNADFNKNGNTFDLIAIKHRLSGMNGVFMGTDAGSGGAIIDGVEFEYNNGWVYKDDSEVRFWEEAISSTVKFYAVSPASHTNLTKEFNSGGLRKIEYTVPTTCSEQVDLMYATASVKVDVNGIPTQNDVNCKSGVNLNFKHALSQILFKTKTNHSKLYAKIESITVKDVCSKGIFKYDHIVNNTIIDDYVWELDGEFNENYQAPLKNNTNIPNTATDISDSPLLLLPQTLSGKTLDVKCTIYFKDNDYSDSINVFEGTISVALTGEWEQGYKYTYTLIFSNELANPIKIGTVNVDNWTDSENDTTLNDSNN